MSILIWIGILCLSIPACKDAENNSAPKKAPSNQLPLLPQEKYQALWEQVDNIDFLFETLPISLNLSDPPSVKNGLRQFTNNAPDIKAECKPTGKVFYVGNGEQLMEADFYYSDSCRYFVFIEHGKKRYSAQMSPSGVSFFDRAIAKTGLKK